MNTSDPNPIIRFNQMGQLDANMLQAYSNDHIIHINSKSTSTPSSLSLSSNEFDVIWKNLSYFTERIACTPFKSSTQKIILRYLNGSFKSGQLTAIMGPSGSGKTTLLECIAGKRVRGVSGDVLYNGTQAIKLSYISQNDTLPSHLSVKESLLFASKLKNIYPYNKNTQQNMVLDIVPSTNNNKSKSNPKLEKIKSFDHHAIVNDLLEKLGLDKCADVKVCNCSGGQIKRLSIAQELVSKPNILILDEPTSGLDSASCFQCVELLLKLATQNDHPIAIVSTIHQPSAKVFSMFHKIYFLSIRGNCIYEGPPDSLVSRLASLGLNCPPFNNPADYMTEVASGDYGFDCEAKLESVNRMNFIDFSQKAEFHPIRKKIDKRDKFPIFQHTWLLFYRTMLSIFRDPMLTSLRLFSHVVVALFVGLLYGNKVGLASGCSPSTISLSSFLSIQNDLYKDIIATNENVANFFFATMFIMFGALMPTILTFPLELNVFKKERTNGWYSCGLYYTAKTLADIPFQIIFPAIYGAIVYYMHSQVWSCWRFTMFISLIVMIALIAQSHGLLVSAFFMDNATAAVFIAPILTVPTLLFAGFFVRIKTMPNYFVPLSYISYIRYGFESLISITYGFGRCIYHPNKVTSNVTHNSIMNMVSVLFPSDSDYDDDGNYTSPAAISLIENMFKEMQSTNPFMKDMMATTNSSTSYVLTQYGLDDQVLYTNFLNLFLYFVVLRIGAYLALLWKTNQKE